MGLEPPASSTPTQLESPLSVNLFCTVLHAYRYYIMMSFNRNVGRGHPSKRKSDDLFFR